MKRKLCLFLCVVLLGVAGCQRAGNANPMGEQQGKPNDSKNEGPEKKEQTPKGDVALKVVEHPQFLEALKEHKGKVVLVDFWGTFCIPCKEKFPKVVKLFNDHRDEGLVCVSASIDEAKDEKAALDFLQKKNAVFPNYLIDELPEVYQNHWNFRGVPAYYVIGRDGEILKNGRFADLEQIHFEDIEKVVLAELRAKK